jgi:hypothetical protein
VSKLRPANAALSLVSKRPNQPDFPAQKRLLLASQEVSICPDVGLCTNRAWWIIAFIIAKRDLSIPGWPEADAEQRAIGCQQEKSHVDEIMCCL